MARQVREKTELRKKFDDIAYGAVKEYARRNSLSPSLLSQVLNGTVTGVNGGFASIEIFEQLRRDGIYTEAFFPWQKEYKEQKAKEAKKSA